MISREQFIADALEAETDDCILWPFAVRASSGYAAHSFKIDGRTVNIDAHRAVCLRAHGPAMTNEEAAHRCGRKLCINKRHLYWALPMKNMDDAKQHGNLRGGGIYRQRIFAADRAEIAASSESLVTIARRYGMEPSHIGRVRRAAQGR